MSIYKNQIPLTSLIDWQKHAGPKSANQWVDGRSAKEEARAWLEGDGISLPPEIEAALISHPDFGSILRWNAEPEAKLRFDDFPGEPRNSDVAVHAVDAHGIFLIAVEAKADESFGESVPDTLASALERLLDTDRSKGIVRAQQLAQMLLGPRRSGDPHIRKIRYQLLTACAGALCEAERNGYSRALMLVHEFITEKTSDNKHRRNADDLDTFVQRISHCAVARVSAGEITGPFDIPGAPLIEGRARLYIGKVVRNLRAEAS